MTLHVPALLSDLAQRPREVLERHGAHVPELAAMRGCPQPPNHHAEGDVWEHTQLAMEAYADLPRWVDHHAAETLARAGIDAVELPENEPTVALAVLLHDVGKPATIAARGGSWTYYGHEHVGARMAGELAGRLRLAEHAAEAGLTLDVEAVTWIVKEHLFWLNTDVDLVTDRALRRRYARDDRWGDWLRVVSWCDTLGSRGPDGRPYVDLMVAAEARIIRARRRAAAEAARPEALLDGHTVMEILGIEPGPRVGAVLGWLRGRAEGERDARALLERHAAWLAEEPLETLGG